MSDEETVGDLVDAAQSAHPGSIHRYGMRITYLGEVQLESPPDGLYHPPFDADWMLEWQESDDDKRIMRGPPNIPDRD